MSQGEEVSREVLDRLRAKVPAVMAQADVAARRRIGADVRTLHGIGWQPDELVCELTRATFDSTHRPVGVLIKRLDALLEAGQPGLWQLHSEEAERQAQLEQQQARRAGEDARDAQQRAEAERWADELAAALPGDKLDELLDLVVAEHHAHLVGRGVSMRRGAARAWLREEYDAAGDVALPAFLTELRAKLDRAPHTTTVAQ